MKADALKDARNIACSVERNACSMMRISYGVTFGVKDTVERLFLSEKKRNKSARTS